MNHNSKLFLRIIEIHVSNKGKPKCRVSDPVNDGGAFCENSSWLEHLHQFPKKIHHRGLTGP